MSRSSFGKAVAPPVVPSLPAEPDLIGSLLGEGPPPPPPPMEEDATPQDLDSIPPPPPLPSTDSAEVAPPPPPPLETALPPPPPAPPLETGTLASAITQHKGHGHIFWVQSFIVII